MVVLHALGQCLIRTAITTITPRAEMCFALASYLTRERGKRVPRRLLEALFWPGVAAVDASHSLSELIHKLRSKGVHIERDGASCVWIPREAVTVDIESLSAEPPTAIADRDLSILPGYAPRASAAFNDWVDEWRGQMQLRVLADVVSAISDSTTARDWRLTLALADQALQLDAESEPALLARARAAEQLARNSRPLDRVIEPTASPNSAAARLQESSPATRWRAKPLAPITDRDTKLVGREREMERLCSQGIQTLRGKGSSTYLWASAGVGKSHLVRELSAWMRANGAAVCNVSCGRYDGHRPLSAFIQAVPRLQAIPGAAGCAPSTLACLARITQLTSDEPPMNSRDDSTHLSESIRASVIDLIDAVADEQPLLLIVEDVHWIDQSSWSLLRTIAAKAQRSVFLVCTSRVRWQNALWGDPDTFVCDELRTLSPCDARAHMVNCLQNHESGADDRFIDWCVGTSGGNPYFIEELANFWIATGEQYTAPPSLVALTEARLACLKPDALRVIQAAAILGKRSTLDLLQQVLEFPTHVLFSSIEELGEAGLLATTTATDRPSVAPVLCRHDLVIRAATRTLSQQGRALLHHAAARAIETAASGSHSTELLWECADHWQAAGQVDRSVRAVVSCAHHLREMGLIHESLRCCESALAVCNSAPIRATVLRAMAQAQYSARDWRAFFATAAEIRTIESGSSARGEIHDDLELCELSAQRSLHRDWKSALETTLRCVY
ncbi:MAG: AAA family ATPase, partial [Gemmatimonadaceae bacterium]